MVGQFLLCEIVNGYWLEPIDGVGTSVLVFE